MGTQTVGIVVGIEGTAAGRAALEWALREGLVRGQPVTVVHAWGQPVGHEVKRMSDVEAQRASVCMLVAAVAEAERAVGGKPEVVERSRHGAAARVLVEEAREAGLLVVGRGHRTGVVDVVGQSVSAECVRHATCPVVVVPADSAPAVGVAGGVAGGVAVGDSAVAAGATSA